MFPIHGCFFSTGCSDVFSIFEFTSDERATKRDISNLSFRMKAGTFVALEVTENQEGAYVFAEVYVFILG